MESLIKQTRSRFSGAKQDDITNTTDRKIQAQKTQSFREKKRSQSWIKRPLSRQRSWDYDFIGVDYPTAVAAAACAIQTLEKETNFGPDKSLNKMKSRVEDARALSEPLKSALKSSDGTSFNDPAKKMPEKQPSIKKKISFADLDEIASNKPEMPATPARAPTMKRPPTFADKELNIIEHKRPETILPKTDRPPMGWSTTQPGETRRQSATKPGPGDPKADAWEKEEMSSIKERYEKLRATVDNWESKKKKKAKRKIQRIEAELDKRRAKAVQSYHIKIARIEGIAEGARAQAEQNRRNEEFKVKEKGNKIRSTGKIPASCMCF